MKSTWRIWAAAGMLGVIGLLVGCSGDSGGDGESGREVVARVGPNEITRKTLEKRIEALPPSQKKKYDSEEGRADYVSKLIEEELLYLGAKEAGYERKPEIREKIDMATRSILVSEYYQNEIYGKAEATQQEVEDYYREHLDEFTKKPLMRARHILFKEDKERAERVRERLVKNPSNFADEARAISEDPATKDDGGDLGYFNPGGYIRSIGFSRKFTDAVFDLEEGEISPVIEHEKGYSIVLVVEKVEGQVLPLAEVQERISEKLKPKFAQRTFEEHLESLKKQFDTENVYAARLAQTTRSPEEYWEIASMTKDSQDRIRYYKELLDKYPDSEYAPQAQFMIGFVYSEEIQDLVEARRAYEKVLQNYPDHEIAESARWMITNLNKPLPNFQNPEEMRDMMGREGS